MEEALKLYVIGAFLWDEEPEEGQEAIYIGEFPHEAFYESALGRSVDVDAEGYEEIPDMKAYLLNYPLTDKQLENRTYLGIEAGNSAYEKLVCPHWQFGDDESTTVTSLEGIEQLANLEHMILDVLSPDCSLEPLTRLKKLTEISKITGLNDYSPLLHIESLKKVSFYGHIKKEETYNKHLEVFKELEGKGVQVENKLSFSKSSNFS